MNILILNHEFPPAGGGAAYACQNLAKQLAVAGHTVEVLTSRNNQSPNHEKIDGYTITRILPMRQSLCAGTVREVLAFTCHGIMHARKTFTTGKPDTVYAFFTLPSGLIGIFIKTFYRIPCYIFLRGIDVPGFYGGAFSFLNSLCKPLIHWLWRRADAIIANSPYLKNLASFPEKQIKIIPNSIDTDLFCPPIQKRASETFTVLFAGRLNKQKNVPQIIESFSLFLTAHPAQPCQLVIIGDGPEKSRVITLFQRYKISSHATLRVWANHNQLAQAYQHADVFISLSSHEGMPNSMLEAMACGLPIIASDIPAHREIITPGKNGILAALRDCASAAHALSELACDRKKCHTMGLANTAAIRRYNQQVIELLPQQQLLP